MTGWSRITCGRRAPRSGSLRDGRGVAVHTVLGARRQPPSASLGRTRLPFAALVDVSCSALRDVQPRSMIERTRYGAIQAAKRSCAPSSRRWDSIAALSVEQATSRVEHVWLGPGRDDGSSAGLLHVTQYCAEKAFGFN